MRYQRVRRVFKWVVTALSAFLLVVWIVIANLQLAYLWRTGQITLANGCFFLHQGTQTINSSSAWVGPMGPDPMVPSRARWGLVLPSWDRTLWISRQAGSASVSRGVNLDVRVPIWLPLVLSVSPALVLWLWRDRRPGVGWCQECGYNLAGNTSGRCPECGIRVGRAGRAGP